MKILLWLKCNLQEIRQIQNLKQDKSLKKKERKVIKVFYQCKNIIKHQKFLKLHKKLKTNKVKLTKVVQDKFKEDKRNQKQQIIR